MVRLKLGSAERFLVFVSLIFLFAIFNFVSTFSSSSQTSLSTFDSTLTIEIHENEKLSFRFSNEKSKVLTVDNIASLKTYLNGELEKYSGRERKISKVDLNSHSQNKASFYARLLRLIEPLVIKEIRFSSKELKELEKMENSIDFFLESRRSWEVLPLSNKLIEECGYSLYPFADWNSDEMEALNWIQSLQFPENCREQELIRYPGYNSTSIVDSILAQSWPLLISLSSEKTFVSTFEENFQSKECFDSLKCNFLPSSSCLIPEHPKTSIEIMKGFSNSPEWDANILQKRFPNQNSNWILSQLIRFLVKPSKELRSLISSIKWDMKEEGFLKEKEKCCIIYSENRDFDSLLKKAKEETSLNRFFLLSNDWNTIETVSNSDGNLFFKPKSAFPLSPYALAATEECDSAYTSDSNTGKFIQYLLAIRTGDYSKLDSIGSFHLPHQTSNFDPKTEYKVAAAQPTIKYVTKLEYNRTKVATIIEERPQPHLIPVIAHFLQMVPIDWPFVVWHSHKNIEMLNKSELIRREIRNGRLTLKPLPEGTNLRDGESMSQFLTKPWFWEQFEAEYILFFQTDSMFCSQSDQSVEAYVGYDYVGAPWPFYPEVTGGNGGLSMRRKSAILNLLKEKSRPDNGKPEDLWYSIHLAPKGNLPPNEVAAKFSVENPFLPNPQRPLGMHRGGVIPMEWKLRSTFQDLQEYCPEIRMFHDPPLNG